MKILSLVLLCPLLIALGGNLHADAPDLEAGTFIKSGSSNISLGLMSAPYVVDWNNDGKKDLLVGQFTQGNITLFLNRGTNAKPTFSGGTKVLVNGVPITTTYG